MQDVISWIVVLVFVGVLFRKRLAPFFRGRKKPEKQVAVENASGDASALQDKEVDNVYVNVFAIDAGAYLNADALSDAIDARLHKQLDWIYRTYLGKFISLDVVTEGDLLLFLISWHT